jgi:hypothetical protein
MTQDEIIKMANQAELCQCIWIDDEGPEIASLVAFAKLIAAKERDRMCKQCNWSKHENATCNEANQPKILGES